MAFQCVYCGGVAETEIELEVEHRACRLKAAFPGAYTELGDGLVTFDVGKISDQLGLFRDWVIDANGELVHPLEGGLHFRVGAGWGEPEVWVELPVQVGNQISSWTYRISHWEKVVQRVAAGIEAAKRHLARREEGDGTSTGSKDS